MYVITRSLPKAGNTAEEYEDASLHARRGVEAHFAVADGATETSFSRAWAEMLVQAYCDGAQGKRALAAALSALQQRWQEAIDAKPLPWYAEAKAHSGAFSTLLGLTVRGLGPDIVARPSVAALQGSVSIPDTGGRWSALAIGDSWLAHVRDGRVVRCFPVTSTAGFTSRPCLLSTNPSSNRHVEVARISGRWLPGDRFYLMTDAVAHWFLVAEEHGETPWEVLDTAAGDDETFAGWATELRSARRMRNDDITLLRVQMP